MKLFLKGTEQEKLGGHMIHVAFRNDDNGDKRQETASFMDGRAEVEDGLGQYLVDKGFAKKESEPKPEKGDDEGAEKGKGAK